MLWSTVRCFPSHKRIVGLLSATIDKLRGLAKGVAKAVGRRREDAGSGARGPARRPRRGSRSPAPGRRGPQPVAIKLSSGQRKRLRRDARRRAAPHGEVVRAKIILELARYSCVSAAARTLGVEPKTVRYWRDRFLREGRRGLRTRPRPGRPASVDLVSRCQLIATACGKPADFDVPFRSVWTLDSLLDTYRKQNPGLAPLSRTTVVRLLHQEGLRPHRMRVWLHSPDPLFREKVAEICKLYLDPPPGSVVVCIDEKTGMQALSRKHPILHPAPGRDGRIDFEYKRHGTVCLIAAFNPHTGEVYAQTPSNRKAPTLVSFMEGVAEHWPDVDVHVIWDNLNTHLDGPDKRWTRFNERHGNRFQFHYTPVHASWVNQVENFFSIVDRRVWRNWISRSKKELATRVMAFIDHWNEHERHPFIWKFQGYPTRKLAVAQEQQRPSPREGLPGTRKGRKNGSRCRSGSRRPARQAARS